MSTRNFETKSGKLINEQLAKIGHHTNNNDVIAFCYTEGEDEGYISLNFNSTVVKFKMDEIDLADLPLDGIKIWPTWSWRG